MVTTLLLWDIDGTLIDSGGAGEHGLVAGLSHAFGIQGDLSWLNYFGRTDRWIFRTILDHYGIEPTPAHLDRYRQAYLAGLRATVENPRARILPGVADLLATLARRTDVLQALLTGNLVEGAQIKLGHMKLYHYFSSGAFADDSENRNDLGPVALARAHALGHTQVTPAQTVVIGDTPHDIACGKAFGARTLAVATGRFSEAELAVHQPDILLPDLSNLSQVLPALGLR